MSNKLLKILALAGWIITLGILFVLLSQAGPVEARPPFQGPPENDQPPVEPFEPAAFPDPPNDEEQMDARAQIGTAAYIVSPTINYQGYLADSGGTAINGSVTFIASLYDAPSGGIREWGPEIHTGVQVQDGLFSLALGQNEALTGDVFDEQLYLELEVNGTTLPRQTLRAVPYAFSLVPGASIQGEINDHLVDLRNDGNDFALWAEEKNPDVDYGLGADKIYSSQGYASGADSYLWLPANLAVTDDAPVTLDRSGFGRLIITSSSTGLQTVYWPIMVPGILYGHPVVMEEVRVYYRTTNANTYINETSLYKLYGSNLASSWAIASTTDDQNSTTYDDYQVPIDLTSSYTQTASAGPLNLYMSVYFDNTSHSIYINGVRLRLGHPRTDQ